MSTNNPKNNQHHRELISGTLDVAAYNGHGHAQGSQGKAGHSMPVNDHAGPHSYIPQAVFNTSSDGAGSANANDPSAENYGAVDQGQ